MTDHREFKPGQRVYNNSTKIHGVYIGRDEDDQLLTETRKGLWAFLPSQCVKLDDRTNTITFADLMARDWGKVGI